MNQYFQQTKTGTYSFFAAIPLIVGYECIMLWTKSNVRVSAGVWLGDLVATFTPRVHLGLGLVVLAVGICTLLYERKQKIELKPHYFVGMLVESVLWVPVFYITVGWLANKAVSLSAVSLAGTNQSSNEVLQNIGIALGAGIYEELIFRVLLVGILFRVMLLIMPEKKSECYVFTAIIGALIFSAVHYIGPLGDDVEGKAFAYSFIFRFVGGLFLNALYLTRGFGIAAWTHAIYDIMVLTH